MEKITERQAVEALLKTAISNIETVWPEVSAKLANAGVEFAIGEEEAKLHLCLAVLAQELENVKVVYSPERHEPVVAALKEVLRGFKTSDWLLEHLEGYIQNYRRSLHQYLTDPKSNPLEHLSVYLLQNWTDGKIERLYLPKSSFINPLVTGTLNPILIYLTGFWKKLKEKFEFGF